MPRYHLGLPAWGFTGWTNTYFSAIPSTLASYASVFNTVEGNTTFYHIPDESSVSSWLHAVQGTDFKFCFKLPRTVTHQKTPDFGELDQFIKRINPLAKHLGPFLLQLPSTTGPDDLKKIDSIAANLPRNFRCAIEVRHEDFFTRPELLESLIEKYQTGRVIMDTRAVFNGDRTHPEVLAALHQKPDLPVLGQVYNGIMMVRLLLHPDLTSNDRYIDQWVSRTAQALASNCDCYIMIHCPNNQHCPVLALQFHNKLRVALAETQTDSALELPPLPPWPVPEQQGLL